MTSASFTLIRPHVPPEDAPTPIAAQRASPRPGARASSPPQALSGALEITANTTDAAARDADRVALELSTSIARGDRDAYEQLYRAWFDRWLAAARACTGRDESFCLDVVQDTAIRVARAISPKPTHAALEAWLFTVLRSCAIDRLRTEKRALKRALRASDSPSTHASAPGNTAHTLAELDERIAWLRAAMSGLARDDADLLAQRFAAGETLQSIASRTPDSRHAVHGRVRRLLQRLRQQASEFFHEP